MVITFSGRRAPHNSNVGIADCVLTGVAGGLISAAPLWHGHGACCLRLWRLGKGCADGGQTGMMPIGMMLGGRLMFARLCERLEALDLGPSERMGLG